MMQTTVQAAATTTSRSEARPSRDDRFRDPGRSTWVVVWALLLALLGGSCRSRGAPPSPSASASSATALSVPEPNGVLAEFYIAHPDRAWVRFQPLLQAAIGFKPVTLSATLTDLLGIPAAYSPGVAIEKPIVGVLVDGDSPRAVIGIRMNSGAELTAALSTGRNPTHRARPLDDGKVTLLEPQRRAPVGELAIGVCGNSLLVGAHGADLAKFGPYVARGLPTRLELPERPAGQRQTRSRPPEGSLVLVIPGETLRRTVVERLRERWARAKQRLESQARDQQRRHGDRAPDFAEPAAAISGADQLARQLFGLLGNAGSLTAVVEPSGELVELRIALVSGHRNAVAQLARSLPSGDSRALLRLPRQTLAAATFASTEPGRQAASRRIVGALSDLFGSRLGAADRSVIEKAFADVARGRGDDFVIGLVATPDGAGVAIGAAVSDAERLDDGVRGALRSLQLRPLAEPLAAFVGRPRVAIDRVPGVDLKRPVTRARIVWLVAGETDTPPPSVLLWTIADGRFQAAMGRAAKAVLTAQAQAEANAASSLAADEQVVAALRRAPTGAAVTLFARPDALGWPGPTAATRPLVLSIGSVGEDLSMRLELDRATVASITKSYLGLTPHRE